MSILVHGSPLWCGAITAPGEDSEISLLSRINSFKVRVAYAKVQGSFSSFPYANFWFFKTSMFCWTLQLWLRDTVWEMGLGNSQTLKASRCCFSVVTSATKASTRIQWLTYIFLQACRAVSLLYSFSRISFVNCKNSIGLPVLHMFKTSQQPFALNVTCCHLLHLGLFFQAHSFKHHLPLTSAVS